MSAGAFAAAVVAGVLNLADGVRLMKQRAERMHEPKLIYVGNVTGRALRTAEAILATNVAHGVRWYDATTVLKGLGCRLFLEMPPGHVLTELGREAFPGVRTRARRDFV